MMHCKPEDMPKSRRKHVGIPWSMLAEAFTEGTQIAVRNGLPAGSRLVSVQADHRYKTLDLCFEHESFPEIADGAECKYLRPEWSTSAAD